MRIVSAVEEGAAGEWGGGHSLLREYKERLNPLLLVINKRLFEALLVQVFE